MNLLKYLKVSVTALPLIALGGCGSFSQFQQDITGASVTLQTVAADIDAGATTINATALPLACSIVSTVYNYGVDAQLAGLIANTSKLATDLNAAHSIITNPICVAAMAGQPVTNPGVIIADIIEAIAAIKADTSGQITATAAVSTSSTPAVVGVRRFRLSHPGLHRHH